MTESVLPIVQWLVDGHGCHWIAGAHCRIWMQARPPYCDRGAWLAHVELLPHRTVKDLHIDSADGWPRYYFDLDRAKAEIEAWLRKRKEVQ